MKCWVWRRERAGLRMKAEEQKGRQVGRAGMQADRQETERKTTEQTKSTRDKHNTGKLV